MNSNLVERKVRAITQDTQNARDLSDAETECLEDLLRGDEVIWNLITAQQSCTRLYADDEADGHIEARARDAASDLGPAIDYRVDQLLADAQAIVEFADEVDELEWGVTISLYASGFESVADLRAATQSALIEAGANRSLAARIKAEVGDVQEVDA